MSEANVEPQEGGGVEFTPTRATRRYVPLETVNAVILSDDFVLAHGIVSNISESGACLITNTSVEVGQKLQIRLSTSNKIELFQTLGRVVWSGEGIDPNLEIVGVMLGVQFLDGPSALPDQLGEILQKGKFHEVGAADLEKEGGVTTSAGNRT